VRRCSARAERQRRVMGAVPDAAQLKGPRPSAHATATFKSLHLPPAPATNGKGVRVRLEIAAGVIIRRRISQLTRRGVGIPLGGAVVGVAILLAGGVAGTCKDDYEPDRQKADDNGSHGLLHRHAGCPVSRRREAPQGSVVPEALRLAAYTRTNHRQLTAGTQSSAAGSTKTSSEQRSDWQPRLRSGFSCLWPGRRLPDEPRRTAHQLRLCNGPTIRTRPTR
jgi:hypothetical protein